ncbi:hypothetical protein L226DRAFT_189703 [Lentinus tigrinus ALCF2SS1-7]|uniref:DUF7918 domain-containing protein n=1 Tax=Lentinus tigrinus ALCF2SS1-6 TaxID=1328759 RepID=A0A5C2T047_9APHY|nr:hypothetical protein L227DRAFT_133643 [Lentinus tigrinus ALCF2SS1-6]RPD80068.1 hypothetical protein L226DRAFT_189703 [Lentinus tigrinus ALCF2SS1-7]
MPLKLNDYTAHITCDGRELEAYGTKEEGDRTVTCWIASEAGKEFVVHWSDETSTAIMKVNVLVDGRLAGLSAHQKRRTGSVDSLQELPGQHRRYQFAPLILTDDDRVASSKAKPSADLGTIAVVMRKVDHYTPSDKLFSLPNVPEVGPVHEKSKKAGVHAVSFGKAQSTAPRTTLTPHGLDPIPFATFKFIYRPLALLQANGIAPKPCPSKRRRDVDDRSKNDGPSNPKRQRAEALSDSDSEDEDEDEDRVTFLQEQITMLQGRLAKEQAKKKNIKREPSPIVVPPGEDIIDLTVKRETSPIIVVNGEVDEIIDLT